MKIHLPVGLRKALLACLAAVAMPAALPATLGTASGVAATIALSALTAQQTAADTTVTKNAEWATFVQDAEKNKAGEKVILQQASNGSIFFGHLVNGSDVDEEILADVEIAADLVLNNGYSNTNSQTGPNYTFSGAITGSGNFKLADKIQRQHYKFTGDMSGWTGNFEITGGSGEDSIEFSGDGFVSSEGKITLTAGNNSKLIADGVTLKNSEITASLLEIRGDVTFSGNSGQNITINGATTIGQGATLTLGANTEMHLASLAANSTLTKLTMGAGSEFGLGTGSLSIDTLVLNGDNASLAMDVTGGATLSLVTLTADNHHLTIYLSGITNELIGTEGYALFGDSGWKAEWKNLISLVTDAGRALQVNEQGRVVWMYELQDLTWTGSDGASLTWTDGGSEWDNNETFHNGDNITLTGSGSSAMQVNVTGGILTGNLIISGDNTGGFTFAAASGGGTLHIGGNLSVSVNTAFNMEVTLDGTVTLSNNAELTVHQNFHFGAGEGLTVDGTGTFKIDLQASGAEFDAAGYSFAEGIAVKCDSNTGGWGYLKNLNVLGTLKLTGKEVVLRGTNVITDLDASGLNVDGAHITFERNVSTTFKNKVTMDAAGLDVRDGTVILEQGADVKYLNMSGGTLNVTAGDLSVTGAMSQSGGTVNLGGHLKASSSTLTLTGGKLVLQSGTATDNTLGTLTLGGNATLGFSLVGDSFTGLTLGTLTPGDHTLTLDLGPELAQYLAKQEGPVTFDLFDGNATNTLKQAKQDGHLTLAKAAYGYTWDVNDQGQLVFSGGPSTITWSETQHQGQPLVWENDNGEGRWDGGGNFAAWNKVELTGNSATDKTITLKGTIQANSVTISGGTGKFVFGSEGNGSLEAADITVGVNTDFNAGVSVVSSLTVQNGVTVNVGDTGSLQMQDGASITVGNGSNLVIAAGKLSHGGEVLQINYNGEEGGSGGVEIKLGGNQRITGISGGKGVRLKLNNTASWAYFQNISALEEVVVAGAQVILEGTNRLAGVTDNGENLPSDLVIESGSVTTLTGDLNLLATALDVRDGQLVMESGTINVTSGLYSNTQHSQCGGYVKGIDLVTTVASGTRTYTGAMELSGNLTKKGDGTQELQGGTGNKISVTGTVTVEAGALNWGKADLESSIGTLTVSGGTFKLLGGTLTVGSITSMSGGALQVGSGTLELTDAKGTTLTDLALGEGATAGNLVVDTGSFTISGGWTWGDGSTLTLCSNGQQITLSGIDDLNGTTAAEGHKLTIDLTKDFLDGDGSHERWVQLFTSTFQGSWVDYFTFTVEGKEPGVGNYDGLTLQVDGRLTWNRDVLYWGGDNEPELTWGGNNGGKFDTNSDGTGEAGWADKMDVHFVGSGGPDRTVWLAGNIITGYFDAVGDGARAKFTFTSDADNSPRTLTVGEAMRLTNADLNFGKDVTLTVARGVSLDDSTMSVGNMRVEGGGISLNNSTLNVTEEADVVGELTGANNSTLKADGGQVTLRGSVAGFSGTLDTGTDGTITLSSTGETGFKGKLTGTGTLGTESSSVTLAGDLSEFSGTLDTGTDGTITLSGDAVSGDVGVKAVGSGTLAVDGGDADVTFSGTVNGVTLKNAGIGELTVTSQASNGNGTKLDGGEGGITLGTAAGVLTWNGKEVTGGVITLSNVTLAAGGLTKAPGAKVYVDTAIAAGVNTVARSTTPQGGIVDVNGMGIGDLDGITVNEHGRLTGVSGGTYKVGKDKELTLHFTAENWGSADSAALIEGSGFNIELDSGDADAQGLHLRINDIEIVEAIRSAAGDEDGATLYLRALNGGTWNAGKVGVTVDWEKEGGLMDILVSAYEFTDDGLTITGSTRDIYIVMDGEHSDSATSNSPADLAEKLATVVTKGKTLTLNWSGVGTVRNLLGEENSHLVINASDGQGLTVTLENAYHKTIHDDRYPGDVTEAQGMDTEFGGTITGGKGVNIVKRGLGTLTVGGDYSVVGDTRIAEGALHLKGTENTLGSLTFAAGEGEKRELQLEGGKTSVGGITTSEGVTGAALKLTGGAELTLTGTSSMADATISSEDNSGKLKLGKGAGLTFTEGKGITGTAVEMEAAELDMGATQSTLTSLNGSGTLKSASGGTVTVGGGEFSGTLSGTGGTLVLKDKVTFTLNNATGTGMNVKLGAGSQLNINVGKKVGAEGETLVLGDIELGDGSVKVDYGKNGIGPNFVQGNISSVGSGSLEFHSDGPMANGKVYTGLTLTEDWQDFLAGITYTGVGNFVKDHVAEREEDGSLVLNVTDAKENKFEREIPGAGKNAHAGAQMLWESLRSLSQTDALAALMSNPTSDYARLVYTLVSDIENGKTFGLERTFAATAGASIATLTPAFTQDIHRQLTMLRNRTTGMSTDTPTDGYDELPLWHAWIQAEGGYHKMDADGTAPGFTLNNWGGTVGVDADISRATTMGLAVTAMYGDLKPDAADSATGDLDTVYLSAFARTMHGAWTHTFVLSGGIADAKLDRTVSYGGGSYRTRGDTDGYVVGALYEVGYTRLVGKSGALALQPIANVELRHVSLSGYTEKGSDAGVDVDDMDMTVLTLGAGARVQAAVGENAFNRSSVLEARLLAKADIGDRSGTTTNAIVGHSKRAEVESAEVGAVGIETGIGISIPLGAQSGSIYADASLEWRDNWVSTNATLGYRINF